MLLGSLAFELYAVALHRSPALGEDRDYVKGRAGPQSGEQRLHRTDAERHLLAVYDYLIPGLVVAHVPLAAEVLDSHVGNVHIETLPHPGNPRHSSSRLR